MQFGFALSSRGREIEITNRLERIFELLSQHSKIIMWVA